MINFDVTNEDHKLIGAITNRAMGLTTTLDRINVAMDLTAVHANGCQLNLSGLLNAPDGHFLHDIYGINRHLDRSTGQLTECFLPRYAA